MMRKNSSYEASIERAVHVSRGVLKLVGAWPRTDRSTKVQRLFVRFLNTLCHLIQCFIVIPGILNMFLKEKNPRRRLKMVGPMCNCLMALMKYTTLVCNNNRLGKCLRCIEEDWRMHWTQDDRKTMTEKSELGRKIAIFCVSCVFLTGFSYRITLPLIKGTVITPENVTIRPLGFAGYFVFFDPQITPAYEIVFTLQFLAGFVTYSVNSAVCSLIALFVLHACGQLEILIRRMEEFVEDERSKDVGRKLSRIVEHHIKVSSFVKNVESAMQYISLMDVANSTLMLCLLGYYIIMEWENNDTVAIMTYVGLLVTFVFNIFIICFIGELLTNQAIKVAITSHTLAWYRLPDKMGRNLILVMAMTDIPLKLTAGKFVDLSLSSFGMIIRTSVAYLNMLRATSI